MMTSFSHKCNFVLLMIAVMLLGHLAYSSVLVRFYMMKKSMWAETVSEKVKSQIITLSTKYCSANKDACLNVNYTSFNSSDVTITGIVDDGRNYLNASISMPLLSDSVLETIIATYRTDLATTVGYHIVLVNTRVFSPPPPTRLNTIIIPISLIIVVALLVATYAVYRTSHKKEVEMIKRHCNRDLSRSDSNYSVKEQDKNGTTNGGPNRTTGKKPTTTPTVMENSQSRKAHLSPVKDEEEGEVQIRARSSASSKESVTAHIEAELAASQQITSF